MVSGATWSGSNVTATHSTICRRLCIEVIPFGRSLDVGRCSARADRGPGVGSHRVVVTAGAEPPGGVGAVQGNGHLHGQDNRLSVGGAAPGRTAVAGTG